MSTMQACDAHTARSIQQSESVGLQVVDLAGRENEQTSECKGDRFRELRPCFPPKRDAGVIELSTRRNAGTSTVVSSTSRVVSMRSATATATTCPLGREQHAGMSLWGSHRIPLCLLRGRTQQVPIETDFSLVTSPELLGAPSGQELQTDDAVRA